MTNFVNSYASKSYAEHPIALWPLDDDAYYISLISEDNKKITQLDSPYTPIWDLKNCSAISYQTESPSFSIPSSPFEEDKNWSYINIDNTDTILKNISNIVPNGSSILVTTNGAHKLYPGQLVTISEVSPSSYNIVNAKVLSVVSNNKVLIESNVTDIYVSGGKITSDTKTLSLQSPNIFQLNQLSTELGSFSLNFYLYQNSLNVNYYEIGYVYQNSQSSPKYSITTKSLTNNVATLTTSVAHGYSVGQYILVSDVDSTFNGVYVITSKTTTTFSYSKTASDIISTSVSPVGKVTSIDDTYVLEKYYANTQTEWINFNSTFDVSQYDAGSVKLVIRINVTPIATKNYEFYINGLSIGQWSEVSSSISLGSYTTTDGPINSPLLQYIKSNQYGILSDDAYYVVENNRMLAQNQSLPIIFGTNTCTKIEYSEYGYPSIIFPGKDMFFEDGRYKKYSLEMWIKIKPSTKKSRKIIGPIDSDYGVYVKEGFLTLVVGNEIASYSISEWYRPMLLHLLINDNEVSMLINGETVASVNYDRKNISLPSTKLSNKNYWGIYSYSDIESFYIDCISIYPYIVPKEVAKKRFVWGQGTESLQFIDDRFSGKTAAIDFSNAKYTANKIYPDTSRWDAGYFNNMIATKDYLSVPSYKLPEIFLDNGDKNSWYSYNKLINNSIYSSTITSVNASTPEYGKARYTTSTNHNFSIGDIVDISGSSNNGYNGTFKITGISSNTFDVKNLTNGTTTWTNGKGNVLETARKFITFRPNIINGSWSRTSPTTATTTDITWDKKSYLLFPSLNFINNGLSSMYGIFEILESISSSRTLISFVNTTNNKNFSITIFENIVSYSLDNIVLYTEQITIGSPFAVGLNLQLASTEFGYDILSFFGSPSVIQVFIGGNGQNTFEGKIYNISFSDQDNYNDTADHYKNNGIINTADTSFLFDHFATYSLVPVYRYNRFFLDINISAQWEEYFPLSYFASYIKDKGGSYFYDLDYLQINLGYPAMFEYIEEITNNLNWTYAQLFESYNTPVFKDYEILDNEIISHYYTYADMKENIEITTNINTLSSSIQSYITFQLISEGANQPLENFAYKKTLNDNLVIDADKENTNANPYKAYYTKFEFKDGVVIYPPKTINFEDVAIVIHFVINQNGILSAPLKIKNLEITSKALNDNNFNEIGTKFGVPLIPYTKDGIYYSSKEKNPLLIYKQITPYIYTTENSGIKILNTSNPSKEYGISMSINEKKSSSFSVGAFQLWMMYDLLTFPQSALPIFEIHYSKGVLEFVVIPDQTGKRAIIYSREKTTKKEFTGLTYYQNGVETSNPFIRINDWNCIGVSFAEELDFSNYSGSINVFGGILFNNLSYYKPEGLGQIKNSIFRRWSKVLNDPSFNVKYNPSNPNANIKWSSWKTDGTWRNVYVQKEELSYVNNPKQIYLAQVGVNSDIVDDNCGFSINADSFRSYTDISWSSYDIVPV